MRPNLASISILMFILSLALLLTLTLLESFLSGLTMSMEKLFSALVLISPAAMGVVCGVISLLRKEPRPWIAIGGIFLNAGFAIFNLMVLAFSG